MPFRRSAPIGATRLDMLTSAVRAAGPDRIHFIFCAEWSLSSSYLFFSFSFSQRHLVCSADAWRPISLIEHFFWLSRCFFRAGRTCFFSAFLNECRSGWWFIPWAFSPIHDDYPIRSEFSNTGVRVRPFFFFFFCTQRLEPALRRATRCSFRFKAPPPPM